MLILCPALLGALHRLITATVLPSAAETIVQCETWGIVVLFATHKMTVQGGIIVGSVVLTATLEMTVRDGIIVGIVILTASHGATVRDGIVVGIVVLTTSHGATVQDGIVVRIVVLTASHGATARGTVIIVGILFALCTAVGGGIPILEKSQMMTF
jgi:hypothetical protein